MSIDDAAGTSDEAAAIYGRGVAHLLAGEARLAVERFTAVVERDPAFAYGHVALAVALAEVPGKGRGVTGARAISAALLLVRGAPRQRRQHVQIVALAIGGQCSRSVVLGQEHLDEFGDDPVVTHALARLCDSTGHPLRA
jgi:predicted Zn-dependent protease